MELINEKLTNDLENTIKTLYNSIIEKIQNVYN